MKVVLDWVGSLEGRMEVVELVIVAAVRRREVCIDIWMDCLVNADAMSVRDGRAGRRVTWPQCYRGGCGGAKLMLYKQRNYRGLCKRIVIFRDFHIDFGQMTSYACLSFESHFLMGI